MKLMPSGDRKAIAVIIIGAAIAFGFIVWAMVY